MESSKFENAKHDLHNVENIADLKANPVVQSIIDYYVAKVPVIGPLGSLIDRTIDVNLTELQKGKRYELIETILSGSECITFEMVNDVEFIINFGRTLEAVNRLATNDKVKYFSNLLKNGYFTNDKIKNDEFEECLFTLSNMSCRQINYLLFLERFQTDNFKIDMSNFIESFGKEFHTNECINIYKSLEFTGFVQVSYGVHTVISHQTTKHSSEDSSNKMGFPPSETDNFISMDSIVVTEKLKRFSERILGKQKLLNENQ